MSDNISSVIVEINRIRIQTLIKSQKELDNLIQHLLDMRPMFKTKKTEPRHIEFSEYKKLFSMSYRLTQEFRRIELSDVARKRMTQFVRDLNNQESLNKIREW